MPNNSLPVAMRRHIRNLADAVARASKAPLTNAPSHKVVWATVASIQPGPPQSLTLNVSGNSNAVAGIRYLSTYNPRVGDTVMCSKYGGDLVVIGGMNDAVPPGGNVSILTFGMNYNNFGLGGLDTGVAIYQPNYGDLILDGWVDVINAWNGTTPSGDIGVFGSGVGWFKTMDNNFAIDMTQHNVSITGFGADTRPAAGTLRDASAMRGYLPDGIVAGSAPTDVPPLNLFIESGTPVQDWPSYFPTGPYATTDPILFCVSRDGTTSGGDPGATQGDADIHLMVVSP